jgi:DNA-binding SARP family transcriptional activator/ABC-type branched-subunit amino acid transport system substrate-binding protein/DNA-binding beta-propeller fold protein YncE
VEFRLLGLLDVVNADGPVRIVRGRESALLALLLLHRNEPLGSERIVEELWAEAAPQHAAQSVRIYISRLRKSLGADRIATTGGGYLIRVVEDELDAVTFERLAAAGAAALAAGEAERAASLLGGALALWRGDALAEFRFDSFAQQPIRRLESLRAAARADLVDAQLALGRAREVVPELEALIEQSPLSERPRGQLMRALYLSGRQADALEHFRETRMLLADELGVDPGPELQELERAILVQDPALGRPVQAPSVVAHRRRLRLLTAGIALVVAAGVAAGLAFSGGRSGVIADSVVLLDGRTGGVEAHAQVGEAPSQIAVGAGEVWVLNSADNTISEIDPERGKLVATFAAGLAPVGLAAGDGRLWVGNAATTSASAAEGTMFPASLSQLDATTRSPLRTIALAHRFEDTSLYGRLPGQRELAVGAGSVWAIGEDGHVLRLDERSGAQRRLSTTGDSLAFGGGELWVDQAGTRLLRVDPRTDRVDLTYSLSAGPGLTAGFGSVWVTDPVQGLLWRLTPGPPPQLRSIPVSEGVTAVAASAGAVWVASVFSNQVERIDPATNRVTATIRLPAPQDLAPAPRGVWVTTGNPPPAAGPLPPSSCGPLIYPGPGRPQFIVASDLALHNPSGISARPMAAGVQAQLREDGYRAGRFTVGYQSCDDSTTQSGSFDWARCVANARAYAADLQVIGVVGTYNSGCASAEIPILDRARRGPLALVSPSNTNGGLTIPSLTRTPGYVLYPDHVRNYARVLAPEQIQYAADAVLVKELGASRVAVLDDGDPSAAQNDRWFSYAANRLRLQVVRIRWSPSHPRPARLVRQIDAAGANAVFVAAAGLPSAAPAVASLEAELKPGTPLVLTDWFLPLPLFRQLAHGSLDGVYVSTSGIPNATLPPPGRRLVAALGNKLSYTAAYGAGAAQLLLAAIARSNGTRASVTANLLTAHIQDGVLGNLTINRHGDPTTAPVTILRLRRGAHNSLGAVDYDGAVVDRVITPPPRVIAGSR